MTLKHDSKPKGKKNVELIIHDESYSLDPLAQECTIGLRLTLDGKQRGGYIVLSPNHFHDPAHFFYALADLALAIGNAGGFPGLPDGPGNALRLTYALDEGSKNSMIAPPPVLPSAAHTIRPDMLQRAREHTARARNLLQAKANNNDFAWESTAAGLTIQALEALLDVIYFGKERAGGEKSVQGTPE